MQKLLAFFTNSALTIIIALFTFHSREMWKFGGILYASAHYNGAGTHSVFALSMYACIRDNIVSSFLARYLVNHSISCKPLAGMSHKSGAVGDRNEVIRF